MKKSKFKEVAACVFIVFLCLLSLAACRGQKLSEDFDEAALEAGVGEVIRIIADKDGDKLREMSTVKLEEALNDDVLNQIFKAIGEGGAFREMTDLSISGFTDQQTGEDLAVVVAKAKYEIRSFTYTITFTKQMKLAGLYYK